MFDNLGHIKWLIDTGELIRTVNGVEVKVFEFAYKQDEVILSAWAKHFRNHYCKDDEIDILRNGTNFSRKEYLTAIKFPTQSGTPGPSIRAGDFGEILVSDYLEYVLNYWVPRTRFDRKTIQNESTKGSDLMAFKFIKENESSEDVLAIFEVKTQFSKKNNRGCLQNAVNDSTKNVKDERRKAESLNAIKQRLKDRGNKDEAVKIERFQDPVGRPYKEVFGAAALFSNHLYDKESISQTDTEAHSRNNLLLLIIRGEKFMELVHSLYERAANEA